MKSVGEYTQPENSVNSVCSVGGMAEGGVGMAGMPYPPTIAWSVHLRQVHPWEVIASLLPLLLINLSPVQPALR